MSESSRERASAVTARLEMGGDALLCADVDGGRVAVVLQITCLFVLPKAANT